MKQNLSVLKERLPHGAIKEIAKRTKLSSSTISQVLNGHIVSPKQIQIISSTCEFLKECQERESEVNKNLAEVLNFESSEQFTARMNNQRESFGEGTSPLL
jgi:transcriptional regulator with XRE-family HTH domain